MVSGGGVGRGGGGQCEGDVEVQLAEEAEEAVEAPDCDDGVEVGLVFAAEDFCVTVVRDGLGRGLGDEKGRVKG